MPANRLPYGAARSLIVSCLALSFIAACQSTGENRLARSSPPADQTLGDQTLARQTLVGQIWDVRAKRPITRDDLLQRIASDRFILLGEIHDNADQHRIQADFLQRLLGKRLRPALAMEQFDTAHQAAINKALAEPGATSDEVADAGQFDRKGWGWPQYQPLVTTAVQARLPVAAMNLSRAEARRVASEGFDAFGDARVARLALEPAWNAQRDHVLREEISEGHCNEVSADALARLVRAQRARDAVMADVLLQLQTSGAVAILGRGHARKDIGVPLYLKQRAPGATVASIGLIEVTSGRERISDYLGKGNDPPFDYLWFTPSSGREEPCPGVAVK